MSLRRSIKRVLFRPQQWTKREVSYLETYPGILAAWTPQIKRWPEAKRQCLWKDEETLLIDKEKALLDEYCSLYKVFALYVNPRSEIWIPEIAKARNGLFAESSSLAFLPFIISKYEGESTSNKE